MLNISKTKKIVMTSLSLAAVSAVMAADFRPDEFKTIYVSGQATYSYVASPSEATDEKSLPVGLAAYYGQRVPVTERIYLGAEGGLAFNGSNRFKVNGISESQLLLQVNALGTASFFFNPYFNIHAKAGLGFQVNRHSDGNNFGILPVIGVGAGLYVSPQLELTTDITASIGSNSYPYKQLRGVSNNQISIGFNYYLG